MSLNVWYVESFLTANRRQGRRVMLGIIKLDALRIQWLLTARCQSLSDNALDDVRGVLSYNISPIAFLSG